MGLLIDCDEGCGGELSERPAFGVVWKRERNEPVLKSLESDTRDRPGIEQLTK